MENKFYVIKNRADVPDGDVGVLESAFDAMSDTQFDRACRASKVEYNPVTKEFKFEDTVN